MGGVTRCQFWGVGMIPSTWSAQSARLDRAQKAKERKAKRTTPSEKEIQKAIQQAFRLKYRLELKATDAGGSGEVKGLVAVLPGWLKAALGLPQELPFGLEAWLHIPTAFPDLLGRFCDVWIFVEVKAPGGRFRPGQKEFLEARRAEGHIAFKASSVDEALDLFDRQKKVAA